MAHAAFVHYCDRAKSSRQMLVTWETACFFGAGCAIAFTLPSRISIAEVDPAAHPAVLASLLELAADNSPLPTVT
eukprot:3029996-Amphidinium_carterae.1